MNSFSLIHTGIADMMIVSHFGEKAC